MQTRDLGIDLTIPDISIVIPTNNSESTITRCVKSLTSQSFPRKKYEIIVVDNSSVDNSVDLAKRAGADKVIVVEHCLQGKARNVGAEHAKANILAFIDSDCGAQDGWLDIIEKELSENDAIGGPILNGNTRSLVGWADYLMEFSGFHEYKKRGLVKWVPSANQVCKKDVFLHVGGFTEKSLSEDVIFGNSLRKAGFNIVYVPELKMLHFCRTKLTQYLENQKLLGKHVIIAGEKDPTIYQKLARNKWNAPSMFFIKLGAKTKRAIKARKFFLFIFVLPLIILGDISFCKGALKEVNEK